MPLFGIFIKKSTFVLWYIQRISDDYIYRPVGKIHVFHICYTLLNEGLFHFHFLNTDVSVTQEKSEVMSFYL